MGWQDVEFISAPGGYVAKVQVRSGPKEPTRGTLQVRLLDDKYQSVQTAEKRIYVPKGKSKVEEVLLTVAEKPEGLDSYAVEVSLGNSRVLKRNYQYKGGREIDILGQNEWIAGGKASLRVGISDTKTGQGLPEVGVLVSLAGSDGKTIPLWEGKTNSDGTIDASFTTPEGIGEKATLVVQTNEEGVKETIQREITLKSGYKILLTSDKPAYQPLQVIHLRALGLHETTLKPLASKAVIFEVEDPKGNKVFKEEQTTSEFGIAAATFQLADEIIEGRYTLRVTLDSTNTEKKVRVERYVLPQFKVKIDTDKPFYLAGEKIKGTVQADYFYGKPVKEAKVTVQANAFDVGFNEFEKATVDTDENGRAAFEITIPEMLVGQPLFKGDTQVTLDIEIHDPADHKENKYHTVTVARDPILVDILPESGTLVPGVENQVYILTRFPTGETAPCKVAVEVPETGLKLDLETDKNGSTVFDLTPKEGSTTIKVAATDKDGNEARNEKSFETGKVSHSVLLRTDSPVYKVGDTARFDVIATGFLDDTLFLDLIKDRQTVLTKTIRLKDGKGSLELPLDATLFGSVEASAYKILTSSEIVRDTKRVFIRKADALQITVNTDHESYKPAEQAQLTFQVADKDGKGKPTAIGIDVVDESVYALAESKPGLLEVFFTLEKELLEPKV
jgi:uncharacterized protein YfaS (alpha-2-macroglobulin family)